MIRDEEFHNRIEYIKSIPGKIAKGVSNLYKDSMISHPMATTLGTGAAALGLGYLGYKTGKKLINKFRNKNQQNTRKV